MAPTKRIQKPTLNIRSGSAAHLKYGTTTAGEGISGVKPYPPGTKPLPEPTSIPEVFIMLIHYVCKQYMHWEIQKKLLLYIGVTFFGSLICDYLPFPKTYLSRNNIFNQYFVKLSWLWTFSLTGSFMILTSLVYCCGEIDKIKKHILRLAVGTIIWFVTTKSFTVIEYYTVMCMGSKKSDQNLSKQECKEAGYVWYGFDISGHTFLLIYCCLLIREESKAIIGWNSLKNTIRNEEYRRNGNENDDKSTQLSSLDNAQFDTLKQNYDAFTPYININFILLTALSLLWDIMLLGTILYYHKTAEKVAALIIAVLMWYITYCIWFPLSSLGVSGDGLFKYTTVKKEQKPIFRETAFRPSGKDDVPMFMGMPLNALRNENNEVNNIENDTTESTDVTAIRGRRSLQSLHKPKSYFDISNKP